MRQAAESVCPACAQATRTIGGLCPNCGQAKDAEALPATRPGPRGGFWSDLDEVVQWSLFASALALVGAALFVAFDAALVVVAGIVLLVLVLAFLANEALDLL